MDRNLAKLSYYHWNTQGGHNKSNSYDSATGNLSFKSGIGTYTYDTTHKHAVAATSNGWSFGYDANGNPSAGSGQGFGLMFYNARWYDPAVGRFAQGDTIVPEGVQGWDRYAYVLNCPIKYHDPSGRLPVGPFPWIMLLEVISKIVSEQDNHTT